MNTVNRKLLICFVWLFFAVVLDLKGLYLLVVSHDDENFKLAKKGIDIEFCFICNAIRVCRFFYSLLWL